MFDIDAGKIIIIGIVALVVIGPKELPRVLRQVGQAVGKMRRMAADFQGQFMDAMKEADVADIRKDLASLTDSARLNVQFDPVADIRRDISSTLEDPRLPSATAGLTDGAPGDNSRAVGGAIDLPEPPGVPALPHDDFASGPPAEAAPVHPVYSSPDYSSADFDLPVPPLPLAGPGSFRPLPPLPRSGPRALQEGPQGDAVSVPLGSADDRTAERGVQAP